MPLETKMPDGWESIRHSTCRTAGTVGQAHRSALSLANPQVKVQLPEQGAMECIAESLPVGLRPASPLRSASKGLLRCKTGLDPKTYGEVRCTGHLRAPSCHRRGDGRCAFLKSPEYRQMTEKRCPGFAVKDWYMGFDEFWAAYPRKVGKLKARKVWQKLAPDADLRLAIQAALEWQSRSVQWTRDGGQFIPHPTTWLTQGRWDDEPVMRAPEPVKTVWDTCPHQPVCSSTWRCHQRVALDAMKAGTGV